MTGTIEAHQDAARDSPVVSIVIATLNERENLPVLVDRLRASGLPSFEVVVVDDGSTDGTRDFLTDLSREDPRFRLIFHDGKQTTVRAQGRGIEAASGEFVVILDSDLQHPPELIPALVREVERRASLVVASRYAPGGTAGPRTLGRVLLSRGAEWLAKLIVPEARAISDPMSGFFAFPRRVYRPLDPRYRGYKLLLFLLVMNRGCTVAEMGYRFGPRGGGASKVTESSNFIPVFLAEVLLARRLGGTLPTRKIGPSAPGVPAQR